jgi:tryptophan synthase alpha chain
VSDRLAARFAACAAEGRAALVTFVTAGDPDPATSAGILAALPAAGADIIEIGMPFTDPMADGPAIQAGNLRSLAGGTRLSDVLAMVRRFRAQDAATPLVLMGYFNPILARGPARFAAEAAEAGLDGVIVVDLPPEEAGELAPHLAASGVHLVRLATPTTDAARLPRVLEGASGFLYYVAVAGVTGANSATTEDIAAAVGRLRAATPLPLAVGFGVRTPEQAAAVAAHADAVVVGSAIVDAIGAAAEARANDIPARVGAQVAALAQAVRTAARTSAPTAARTARQENAA